MKYKVDAETSTKLNRIEPLDLANYVNLPDNKINHRFTSNQTEQIDAKWKRETLRLLWIGDEMDKVLS